MPVAVTAPPPLPHPADTSTPPAACPRRRTALPQCPVPHRAKEGPKSRPAGWSAVAVLAAIRALPARPKHNVIDSKAHSSASNTACCSGFPWLQIRL